VECRRSVEAGWVDGVRVYSAHVSAQKQNNK